MSPKIASLSSALISCFSIQLIFSFNNNKNEPSDKPTHDRGQSFLPSLSGNAAHPEPHPSPHPLADVQAAVESQDFPYTGALSRTAAHQPVHGAGKGRDTLYEGMETESTGENNACMAATAVRGDQKGTVERLLVVSVFRNAMPRKMLVNKSILRGIDVCP